MFQFPSKILRRAVLSPKLSDEELAEHLRQAKERLPVPVFWLLGKTQSGKTSIIKALTGHDAARIGDGFQACTRTARLYAYPDSGQPILHFLDTRGLGESRYDPTEDMALFSRRAHLLLVTLKAGDHAQQAVIEALRGILRANPHWPVLVAQTCLHELYPQSDAAHILPYPYAQSPLPPGVPEALRRSLLQQRELFKEFKQARFCVLDFTLEEDAYTPQYYGLPALWDGIEEIFPLGLRRLMEESGLTDPLHDAYARAAHPHIITYAVLAGGAAAVPVPMVGIPLVLSVQAKMFHAVASIYNQELNLDRFVEIVSTLGLGYAFGFGGRELLKFIPAYGAAVSSVYSAAVTYALGKTLCVYFSRMRQGDVPDEALFKQVYEQELARGREVLKEYLDKMRV